MNNKNLRSMAATGLVFMFGGCATMEYVPINRSRPETVQTQLAVGDTVHIRLQNGDEWQFRIVALEPGVIVGRDARIAYKDIDLLEVKNVDVEGPVKVGLAVGALALVYIAAAVIEAELDEEEGTYCDSNGVACLPRD
jgi:hypothetical protein